MRLSHTPQTYRADLSAGNVADLSAGNVADDILLVDQGAMLVIDISAQTP
jgi:hypothetical protein